MAWHSVLPPSIQTAGVFSFGLKPMNATFLPAISSPTRRMRGCGSPGPCNAATDHSGSVDSVTISTCMPSHAGDDSGSLVSGPAAGVSAGSGGGTALSGPVTESNGLRSMMACPLLGSRVGTASLYGGTTTTEEPEADADALMAEPTSCVAPAA